MDIGKICGQQEMGMTHEHEVRAAVCPEKRGVASDTATGDESGGQRMNLC